MRNDLKLMNILLVALEFSTPTYPLALLWRQGLVEAVLRNYKNRRNIERLEDFSGSICQSVPMMASFICSESYILCDTSLLYIAQRKHELSYSCRDYRVIGSSRPPPTLPEALPPAIPITYASSGRPSMVYHGARLQDTHCQTEVIATRAYP